MLKMAQSLLKLTKMYLPRTQFWNFEVHVQYPLEEHVPVDSLILISAVVLNSSANFSVLSALEFIVGSTKSLQFDASIYLWCYKSIPKKKKCWKHNSQHEHSPIVCEQCWPLSTEECLGRMEGKLHSEVVTGLFTYWLLNSAIYCRDIPR